MAKQPVIRIRMDAVAPVNSGDPNSLGKVTQAIQDLREAAAGAGLTIVGDIQTKVGAYAFNKYAPAPDGSADDIDDA